VTPRWIEPVTLAGEHVVLEPLAARHAAGLARAAADGELWRLWFTSVPEPSRVGEYVAAALAMRDELGAMPFAVLDKAGGEVIGSTRCCNVEPRHRRLEIGHTWYAKRAQRTGANTECKLLLLGHAFERLGAIAVELRTSSFNQASQRAIERLGAKRDGVLRNHMILPDGTYRDTVVYSILESEWPAVRRHLRFLLDRPGAVGRRTAPG
jgi:RimJ/RimL family protein N-acetyltransferase